MSFNNPYRCFLKIRGIRSLSVKSKMAAAESVFICNFGSRRARQANLVSISPQIDNPDKSDLSVLRFDAILDVKSNMAAHPIRLSTAET